MPPEQVPSSNSGTSEMLCPHCGADWTWFIWEGDDEPPCFCDLQPDPEPGGER